MKQELYCGINSDTFFKGYDPLTRIFDKTQKKTTSSYLNITSFHLKKTIIAVHSYTKNLSSLAYFVVMSCSSLIKID